MTDPHIATFASTLSLLSLSERCRTPNKVLSVIIRIGMCQWHRQTRFWIIFDKLCQSHRQAQFWIRIIKLTACIWFWISRFKLCEQHCNMPCTLYMPIAPSDFIKKIGLSWTLQLNFTFHIGNVVLYIPYGLSQLECQLEIVENYIVAMSAQSHCCKITKSSWECCNAV